MYFHINIHYIDSYNSSLNIKNFCSFQQIICKELYRTYLTRMIFEENRSYSIP